MWRTRLTAWRNLAPHIRTAVCAHWATGRALTPALTLHNSDTNSHFLESHHLICEVQGMSLLLLPKLQLGQRQGKEREETQASCCPEGCGLLSDTFMFKHTVAAQGGRTYCLYTVGHRGFDMLKCCLYLTGWAIKSHRW